jgi:hypothetical protein
MAKMVPALISFDIDGTMVFGEPPGRITPEAVLRARELGCIVGSGSDRTVGNQQELFERHGVHLDFISLKHRLAEAKGRFEAICHLHIGDSEFDEFCARRAGFDFLHVDEFDGDIDALVLALS